MNRFNPATDDAATFCGLTAADRAYLAENGFRFEALQCVRFLDDNDGARWFHRKHELLGYVFAITDGGAPIRPAETLQSARESFGPCDVLWP